MSPLPWLAHRSQVLLHWQFRSQCRGGASLIEALRRRHPGVDLGEYISFNCLRTHGEVGGRPVTEQVRRVVRAARRRAQGVAAVGLIV